MDLASLKDLDLNDIFAKLKSGGLSDKKNSNQIWSWLWCYTGFLDRLLCLCVTNNKTTRRAD